MIIKTKTTTKVRTTPISVGHTIGVVWCDKTTTKVRTTSIAVGHTVGVVLTALLYRHLLDTFFVFLMIYYEIKLNINRLVIDKF